MNDPKIEVTFNFFNSIFKINATSSDVVYQGVVTVFYSSFYCWPKDLIAKKL